MYNIINGKAPQYLSDSFRYVSSVHSKNTRQNSTDKLYVPNFKLETGKRTFKYRGAVLWNNIPDYIKESPSESVFKTRYKNFLRLESFSKDHFNIDL